MIPAITLPQLSAKDQAATIRAIVADSRNKFLGVHVEVLKCIADQLEAACPCQHESADLYHFNAARYSGSCRDCGADVRTPVQQ